MTDTQGAPFETGQPIVLGAGPSTARRWYRTIVRRVDARLIWLDGAPDDQTVVDVRPGEDVTCHTWRYMDALYQVDAKVAFVRMAPEPLIGVAIQATERIQQREYVRVPLATGASGLYLGPSGRHADLAPQPLRLEVRDLSAGGLRGRSSLALEPGDELLIELPLPSIDVGAASDAASTVNMPLHVRGRVVALPEPPAPLELRARVVRLIDTFLPEALACEIGVTFLDMPKEAHERIIRFALGVQRDRRRRGML